MESGEQNRIDTFITLTESWKAAQRNYVDAAGLRPGSPLDVVAARAAESDRRSLYSELQYEISRLRAQYSDDSTLRAAADQFQTRSRFLLFGEAKQITPYLDAVIRQFSQVAESQTPRQDSVTSKPPLEIHDRVGHEAKQAIESFDSGDLRTIHRNWIREGWANRLLNARATRAMTQKEAAYECGVSSETFERWERGKQPPAFRNMALVLKFIRVGMEKIESPAPGHILDSQAT